MKKKFLVELSEQEREYLHKLVSSGSAPARKLNRARILLKADVGKHAESQALGDRQIAQRCSRPPLPRSKGHARTLLRGRCLRTALERSKPDRVYGRSSEGRAEAHPIALARSEPPRGRDRWSFRLLADKAVGLGIVEEVSHETVRKTLEKTNSSLTRSSSG
jgi:hypothetical protein